MEGGINLTTITVQFKGVGIVIDLLVVLSRTVKDYRNVLMKVYERFSTTVTPVVLMQFSKSQIGSSPDGDV